MSRRDEGAMRIIGVLLAAGRGRRMGRTKQVLPWPPGDDTGTMVAASFDLLAPECDQMLVTLGHDAEAVCEALRERRYREVVCDADGPMFESIRTALRVARDLDASAWVMIHPADLPAVRPSVLRLLRARGAELRDCAVMPEHASRGGHPVLVPPSLVAPILAHAGEGGLRQYWRDHPEQAARVPVDDPGVTRDLDTPEAYRAAAEPGSTPPGPPAGDG